MASEKRFIVTIIIAFLCSFSVIQPALAAEGIPLCGTTCMNMKQIFEQSLFVGILYVRGETTINTGTGVVIKINGNRYIITNNHVVDNALNIWVSFYKYNKMYEISVVGRDPAADLALLSASSLPASIGFATFGKTPEVGEEVYALGYPFGIRSVTVGNVNALESASWLYLLTQAPVNLGNSGGPLFNSAKDMVGINTAILEGKNMSFAIPINYIKMILPRLIQEKVVKHGDIDFNFNDTSHIPPLFFLKNNMPYPSENDGIVVVAVKEDSSSYASGIRKGDLILKVNGSIVKSSRDLDSKIFFGYNPDDEVTLTTQRGQHIFERRVKLVEYTSVFSEIRKE